MVTAFRTAYMFILHGTELRTYFKVFTSENKLILVLAGEGVGRGIVSFCFPSNINFRFKRHKNI